MANVASVSEVNDEIVVTNNTGVALISSQPACGILTVTNNISSNPLEFGYSVNASAGYVRLLNSSQTILNSTQLPLSGKQTLSGFGYYYVEYIG